MNDLAHIENELTELRQRLSRSSGVLDRLALIQTEFEDLARTYQQLTEYIDQTKVALRKLDESQDAYDKRFMELSRTVEGRHDHFQTEALNREQLLKGDLARQIEQLKEESERKRSDFLRDWDHHRESVRNQLDELGVRMRLELKTLAHQLDEAKPDDDYLLKLERVEAGLRKSKGITLEIEQRLNTMQKWVVAALSIGFLALGLSLWPMIQQLA